MANKKELSHSSLKAKAIRTFNKWIRNRDEGKGCISCKSKKIKHCSHYFSAGHYPALQFNEINCNGSCIRCNRYLHGNLIAYRASLVHRYGIKVVTDLENAARFNGRKKWSRFELELIIKNYQ